MTTADWKKYNSLVSTDSRSGLRISDNAFFVEGEKGKNNYKLVFFNNSFDDKPITAVYGIGDSGFYFDKVQFDTKKVAEVINKVEKKVMMTRKSLGEYCDILVKAMDLYSPNTVIAIQEALHSDQEVTRMLRLVEKNLPEDELLDKIHELQEN